MAGPAVLRHTGSGITGLSVSRIASQALSFAWFLIATRRLDVEQFGLMASGLALFALISMLGDLGTTRSAVRHIAPDPAQAWPRFLSAVRLRAAGCLAIGAAVLAIAQLWGGALGVDVVVLAAAIAVASGTTDLGYVALRSVGRLRAESLLLVGERLVFLVVVDRLVSGGGGAVSVLAAYLATNVVSALVVTVCLRARSAATTGAGGGWLDREGRRTALGSAMLSLGPRTSVVILSIIAAPTVVGPFAVAWRPVEAIALLVAALVAPLFPPTRAAVAEGRRTMAVDRAAQAGGGALLLAIPAAVAMLLQPDEVVELLAGGSAYPLATSLIGPLGLVAVSWSFRAAVEQYLLADERAGTFVRAASTGLVVNVVAGVLGAALHGARGAAVATIAAEAVNVVVLVARVPELRAPPFRTAYRRAAILAVATAVPILVLEALDASTAALAAAIGCGLAGTIAAIVVLRGNPPPRPAQAGSAVGTPEAPAS